MARLSRQWKRKFRGQKQNFCSSFVQSLALQAQVTSFPGPSPSPPPATKPVTTLGTGLHWARVVSRVGGSDFFGRRGEAWAAPLGDDPVGSYVGSSKREK